jgi:Holliday junction resolvase RusA-like endonuclease
MLKFVLPFTARSKKNNRPIFFNKKIKRPFLGKSKQLRDFEKQATSVWKEQIAEIKLDQPLAGPLQAAYRFYYSGAQKADLCNLIVTLNDLAQDAGIIENDKDIKLIIEAEIFENMGVDRCEFLIGPKVKKASKGVSANVAASYLQKITKIGPDRKG